MSRATQSSETIFAEAIEIQSPQERAVYVAEACRGDDALQREVERLVENHFRAGDFLETPPARRSSIAESPLIEGPGTPIGPFKLVEQIGEGGFGVVYLAEQERPVRRRVALKIIKPGMDTRQVIARFEAERQALALMDHSSIAKVLDAGATETGRPYFVMELVQGVPIMKYCDQCSLSTRERLELFAAVCHAVQHAHQKGVIHRDLKPTNVLVAIEDGRPVPKIIDFGVAKAINQRLTENSVMTGFAQMIGTPLYMSPEQAELSALGVDTRTDIYSLGVILYELLTGTTPFDRQRLQTAAFDEVRRIIREEEPPRPSDRLTTLAANTANTIAESQRTEAPRLRKAVRGELDWIVMKCLEKDRDRRYESAGSLARDIQRYLSDEPVLACPPSARYRLGKLVRRNQMAIMTASLVAAALIVGTLVSSLLAVRAMEASKLAAEEREKAQESFQNARQAVDDMYTQVAEKWLSQQPQMEPLQRHFLTKALQFYTEFAKESANDPSIRFETARAYGRIAEIQHRLGQPAVAEDAFHQAARRLQSLADNVESLPEQRAELAAVLHKLGVLLGDTGRSDEEEQLHRRALALDEKLLAEFPGTAAYRCDVGRAHWLLGQALLALGRPEQAEKEVRSALAIQNSLLRDFPAKPEYRHHLAQTHLRLGLTLRKLKRLDECYPSLMEASEILEALVRDDPTRPDYRNELANVHYWLADDFDEKFELPVDHVEQHLRRAINIQNKLVADYPSITDYRYDLFRSQSALGKTLTQHGQYSNAEPALREAIRAGQKLAEDAPHIHYYRGGLAYTNILHARLLAVSGRHDDAVAAYREATRLLNALVAEVPAVRQYRLRLQQANDELDSVLSAW